MATVTTITARNLHLAMNDMDPTTLFSAMARFDMMSVGALFGNVAVCSENFARLLLSYSEEWLIIWTHSAPFELAMKKVVKFHYYRTESGEEEGRERRRVGRVESGTLLTFTQTCNILLSSTQTCNILLSSTHTCTIQAPADGFLRFKWVRQPAFVTV